MAEASELIGTVLAASTFVIERGPVANFAAAVKATSPVYRSPVAAAEAGFAGIPITPTYTIAAAYWGAFEELAPPADQSAADIGRVLGELRASGGLILHGEQEFVYHRPAVVGETLTATGRIVDMTVKEGAGGATMSIVKAETVFRDPAGELVVTSVMSVIHRSAPRKQ